MQQIDPTFPNEPIFDSNLKRKKSLSSPMWNPYRNRVAPASLPGFHFQFLSFVPSNRVSRQPKACTKVWHASTCPVRSSWPRPASLPGSPALHTRNRTNQTHLRFLSFVPAKSTNARPSAAHGRVIARFPGSRLTRDLSWNQSSISLKLRPLSAEPTFGCLLVLSCSPYWQLFPYWLRTPRILASLCSLSPTAGKRRRRSSSWRKDRG